MLLSLYEDDGLIACKRKEVLDTFVSSLVSEITCHEPTCYVGMEITRDRTRGTLCINQQGYISQVLCRFGMEDCKSAKSSSTELTEAEGEENRFLYREAIDCLNYVTII